MTVVSSFLAAALGTVAGVTLLRFINTCIDAAVKRHIDAALAEPDPIDDPELDIAPSPLRPIRTARQ